MRPWRRCEGTAGSVWRGPWLGTLPGRAPYGRWPEPWVREAAVHPAGIRPGERGGGRWVTGSFPAGLNPFAHWRKGMRRRLVRWGRSDGRMPTAKEGRARWRPVLTVGEEGLARLHNGRGGIQGGLLLGPETPPQGN